MSNPHDRSTGMMMLTVYFLTILSVGLMFPLGWRSIYPLFAPLSILVPVGLIQVFKPIWTRLGYVQEVKVRRSKTVKVKKWLPSAEIRIVFLLVLVGLMMWGNHSSTLYTYLSRQPELNNFKEEKFNHAILVLSTLPSTNYWAGDDARFEYLKVFDLEVKPMPTANFTRAYLLATESKLAVWQIIASKALAITSSGRQLKGSLAETLLESKLFQQTYTNDYVYVFKPR